MSYSNELARRAFNESPAALQTVCTDLVSDSPDARAAAQLVLMQALPTLAHFIHEACRQTGIRIDPMPPSQGELQYLAAARPAEFFAHGARILATLWELRRVAPGLRADDPLPVEPSPASAPAQKIDITVRLPDEMKIASLPARATTVDIVRDSAGAIISSTQVERDAA